MDLPDIELVESVTGERILPVEPDVEEPCPRCDGDETEPIPGAGHSIPCRVCVTGTQTGADPNEQDWEDDR